MNVAELIARLERRPRPEDAARIRACIAPLAPDEVGEAFGRWRLLSDPEDEEVWGPLWRRGPRIDGAVACLRAQDDRGVRHGPGYGDYAYQEALAACAARPPPGTDAEAASVAECAVKALARSHARYDA